MTDLKIKTISDNKLTIVTAKLHLERGGGSHWTVYLFCQSLRKLGIQLTLYSLNPVSEASKKKLNSLGIPVTDLDNPNEIRQLQQIAKLNHPIILVFAPISFSYKLKRMLPQSKVFAYFNTLSGFCTNPIMQQNDCWEQCSHFERTLHHSGNLANKLAYLLVGPLKFKALRSGYNTLDGCIFDSIPLLQAYKNIYNLNQKRCFLVSDPFEIDFIQSFRSNISQYKKGKINLLYMGTFAKYKGLSLLFEALRRCTCDWQLSLFGDGEDRQSVEKFAKEFSDRIEYHGYVYNRDLFAKVACKPFVFVHPCLWFEAFGRSIVEAMILGIPVIVPDKGGPSWIVKDGVNGLHYTHRNADSLSQKIDWASNSPKQLSKLAIEAQKRAQDFDCDKVSQELYKVLFARKP